MLFTRHRPARIAHIVCPGERHFSVWLHSGSDDDLLVNTSDPYDGRVRLSGPGIIEVNAVCDWTLDVQ